MRKKKSQKNSKGFPKSLKYAQNGNETLSTVLDEHICHNYTQNTVSVVHSDSQKDKMILSSLSEVVEIFFYIENDMLYHLPLQCCELLSEQLERGFFHET